MDAAGLAGGFCGSGDFHVERAGAESFDDGFVLFADAIAEGIGSEFGRRSEIGVVGGATVENAPILVHDGIDYRVSGPAVFRLDVEDEVTDADIRVEAGTHATEQPRDAQPRANQYKEEFI